MSTQVSIDLRRGDRWKGKASSVGPVWKGRGGLLNREESLGKRTVKSSLCLYEGKVRILNLRAAWIKGSQERDHSEAWEMT